MRDDLLQNMTDPGSALTFSGLRECLQTSMFGVAQLGLLSDDELYEIVGMDLQGSGLGMSPADRARFGRFAKSWLDNKGRKLWSQVQSTDTCRIWLESAGRDQVVDPDTVDRVLAKYI